MTGPYNFNPRVCPECDSPYSVHLDDCALAGTDSADIERAYLDIISRLTGREDPWSYTELRESVNEVARDAADEPVLSASSTDRTVKSHPGWTPLHDRCLHALKGKRRAVEGDDGIDIGEGRGPEGVVPQHEPLRTVFEYGPIDGCKDYAVYTMVSWSELVGLTWEQTRALVVYWLRETGRWESEDWGERSPEQVVDAKQHIHEKGMGWGEYPEMAKAEIETSGAERQLDADSQASMLDRETLTTMDVA